MEVDKDTNNQIEEQEEEVVIPKEPYHMDILISVKSAQN